MTIAAENARAITNAAPSPSALPFPGVPTIRLTPTSAAVIDTSARRVIASRSANQARSAAPTGATAWMKKTLATVAWLRATMKDPDAIAMQTATARPARPVERRAATGRPWLEIVTKTASAIQAKTARPAT
jgi:hypothetical protein